MPALTNGADFDPLDAHLADNTYFDRNFECDAVKVLPGEYYATTRDMAIVTVLGSCVAACIRDRDKRIGGLNHFMLPDGGERGVVSESARYGAFAMEVLINRLLGMGARRTSLEAKVFGGGRVMAALTGSNVGDRNAAFVLDYLKLERIPVVAQDLLDVYPRKVYFFPVSGRVMVKKLVDLRNETLIDRERAYRERLTHAPRHSGDVELFD
ncbi:chemoreceptor glutamine deamidase CheD [Niveibacterium umoris]|uniref:Probable chemoreceptor glutamine deamidase CheD n=1 Tax=Niveibacterium umoris TaxID=1193620 RepID=A0A840BCG2_9RHOO|nr:chemoreceptor glutamine deamidase CheD [Niveibacterium umoris]MBB4011221.1 chemotaxis protein CheD [Niveibacterium umoris]